MFNIDTRIEGNHNRRMANQSRALDRAERLELKAEKLVGELVRDGKTVYYINLTNTKGVPTGKIKESASEYSLIEYLIRNGYVS